MVTDSPFANKEPFTPEGEPTRRGLGVWTAKAVHSQAGPPTPGRARSFPGDHWLPCRAGRRVPATPCQIPSLAPHVAHCAAVVLQARVLPARLPPLAAVMAVSSGIFALSHTQEMLCTTHTQEVAAWHDCCARRWGLYRKAREHGHVASSCKRAPQCTHGSGGLACFRKHSESHLATELLNVVQKKVILKTKVKYCNTNEGRNTLTCSSGPGQPLLTSSSSFPGHTGDRTWMGEAQRSAAARGRPVPAPGVSQDSCPQTEQPEESPRAESTQRPCGNPRRCSTQHTCLKAGRYGSMRKADFTHRHPLHQLAGFPCVLMGSPATKMETMPRHAGGLEGLTAKYGGRA